MHTRRRFSHCILLASLIALLVVGVMPAQTDRGTITGTVTDPSGAVLVGAKVTVVNTGTGSSVETNTSGAGLFTVPQLTVGVYRVTIEEAGFKKYIQEGVTVSLGQTVRVEAALQVGEVSQSVEVQAEAPVLKPDTSELGTTISNQQILDLPLSMTGEMRNPTSFMRLVPGVVGRGSTSMSNPEAIFNTAVNGGQTLSLEIQLDGAAILGSNLPGDLRIIGFPVDAVQEFKLSTNNFAAELGRTGGGVTSFTLKSGTNQIHGSVYEFFRNEKLNANGFFNNLGAIDRRTGKATRVINKQNEYGFTLGGPVIKDKTFAFGYFNGFRYRRAGAGGVISVPTTAFKNGDFSSLGIPIYDPATTRSNGSGGFIRDQFPGNVIPANRISSVAKALQAFLPDPTSSGNLLNFIGGAPLGTSTDQWGFKVDHSFSTRHKLNASLAHSYFEEIPFSPFTGPLATGGKNSAPIWVARLSEDWFIRPNIINHGTIAYNRNNNNFVPRDPTPGCPSRVGLKGVNQQSVCPQLNILNYPSFGPGGISIVPENGWNFVDNVTWITGKHTFKFGFDIRYTGDNTYSTNRDAGYFNFSNLETALPGSPNTGSGYASFLLGAANSGEAWVYGSGSLGNRSRYYASFVQDDYKVTPKLTLNLGMRYDIQKPRFEVVNRFATFDPTLPNPGAGGRLGAIRFASDEQRTFADTDLREFGPRFGLAYSLNDKTVFRGGYGIYYSAGGAAIANGHLVGFAMGYSAPNSIASLDGGVTPAFYLDQGFPIDRFPRPPFISPTAANNSSPYYMADRDGHGPYIQNWNLNIQREIPGKIVVDMAYVGSKGTRLGSNLSPENQLPASNLRLGQLLFANINSDAARAAGIPIPYPGFNGSVAQALRPYPQYLGITRPHQAEGHSTYHAYQMKIEKRFSEGLAMLVSYTGSKVLTNANSQLTPFSVGVQDKFNRQAEKSIGLNDYPHNLVMSYSYDLPLGPGKKWVNSGGVAGKVVGGWKVSGIQQYQSGSPMRVTINQPYPGTDIRVRPNVVAGAQKRSSVSPGDYDPNNPNLNRWINAAAFAIPAFGTLGNATSDQPDLRTPSWLNEDFSIVKRTPINERIAIDFRTDFINAFNRVVFGGASTNLSVPSTFGRLGAQANQPRTIQFGLKVTF